MQSKSHQFSVFVRTSSGRFVLRPLCQRSCCRLRWFTKESSFLGLQRQHLSSSYRLKTRQEKKQNVPAKTVCLRPMQAVRSFIMENLAQPVRNPHRHQILSGIMRSVAFALGATVIPYWISKAWYHLNVRLKREEATSYSQDHQRPQKEAPSSSADFQILALSAFSAFIVWDIRNLSHDKRAAKSKRKSKSLRGFWK